MTNVNLSETVLLEHGTIRALLSHLTGNCTHAARSGKGQVPSVVSGAAGAVLNPTSLSSWSARWPGGVSAQLHGIMHASGDAVSSIPLQRWSPTGSLWHLSSQQNESVRYGGFLAGAQEFDHSCFGVSPAEAAVIDPQHRLLLEVGYSALVATGMRRAMIMRSDAGVYLGIMNVDYQLQGRAAQTVFAATSRSISIAAGRLSFTLGLNGPSQSVDTACSSALVAMHAAASGVLLAEHCDALCASVSLMLSPLASVQYAQATMLSPDGRCKAFDERANGYTRSEGVCSVVLTSSSDRKAALERVGGSAVRQDGRSASLTAPNGSAQVSLILQALGRASGIAAEITGVQAHGTGTALGDPTEISALGRALRDVPNVGRNVGSSKASMGHSEPCAGHLGLVATSRSLMSNEVPGNAQLRSLNGLLPPRWLRLSESPLLFPLQRVGRGSLNTKTGVSSFGFSGTIAHIWVSSSTPQAGSSSLFADSRIFAELKFRRCCFPWSEVMHPLIQHRIIDTADVTTVRSASVGRLYALVSDHVVQGSVVFPGAAYLEAARAACFDAAGGRLCGVGFLHPLRLTPEEEGAAVSFECVVRRGRSFEIRSGGRIVSGDSSEMQTHCEGSYTSQGAVTPGAANIAQYRSRCDAASEVVAQYKRFHVMGLQYGPTYRLVQLLWAATPNRNQGRVARLKTRVLWQGTTIHPADLDSSFQLGVQLLSESEETDKLRLPFAVDDALLQGAPGRLWAVRVASSHHTAHTLKSI